MLKILLEEEKKKVKEEKERVKEEKERVNDLFSKSKGNTINIQNNINGKFKDNFE